MLVEDFTFKCGFVCVYVWQGVRINKSNEKAWGNLIILHGPERAPFFCEH